MNGYIDLHCHLLPELDDGSESIEETKEMLQIAYREGIRTIFATPHFHPKRGISDAETVLKQFAVVYRMMKQEFPDMEMYEGNEIYYRQDIVDRLRQGELLTLANSGYVLIEFSTMDDAGYIKEGVNNLLRAGFYPIIAHVERYENVIYDVSFMEELVDAGAYIQVNTDSVLGGSGGKIKRILRKMMKNNMVHFLGTDAHSAGTRAPYMEKCAKYLEKKCGEETVKKMLYENPLMVIENKII